MTGGRHLSTTASVSPRHVGTTACELTNLLSFIAEHYEWFCGLSTDASLWDPTAKAMSGSHDFFPMLTTFHMQAITQAQLITLSQAGAWGNIEKPRWDMAYLLIAPSIAIGCERLFGLTMVWAHPHQAHFPTLPEVDCKLVLLADISEDWPYAFMWLNDTVARVPLSDVGHISAMTDGMPSTDTHGQLHQLQVCKLLQHGEKVVCLQGLNGDLEALQFSFTELPLWDMAAPGKPFQEPWFLEVDLGQVQPEGVMTAIQDPTTTPVPTHSLANTI